jgi:hypothetical protein
MAEEPTLIVHSVVRPVIADCPCAMFHVKHLTLAKRGNRSMSVTRQRRTGSLTATAKPNHLVLQSQQKPSCHF